MTATVIAKCVDCGATKEVASGEVAPGDMPMCGCAMPMVAVKAVNPYNDWKQEALKPREAPMVAFKPLRMFPFSPHPKADVMAAYAALPSRAPK